MSHLTPQQIDRQDVPGSNMPVALATHVEALTKSPSAKAPLSAQRLLEGGLVPVQAWMRSEKTGNAIRVARSRKKLEQEGVKQLNLLAPVDLHDLLRSVAKASPDEAQLIAAAFALEQANNESQMQRRKCQRGILDAPPEKLIQIQKVLAQAPLSSSQKAALADQQRIRQANLNTGQLVRSLRGWRRLLIRLIIGSATLSADLPQVGSTVGSGNHK